jgi:hypothetical protein
MFRSVESRAEINFEIHAETRVYPYVECPPLSPDFNQNWITSINFCYISLHSPIPLHDIALNKLNTGKFLPFLPSPQYKIVSYLPADRRTDEWSEFNTRPAKLWELLQRELAF